MTHGHSDHVGDTIALAQKNNCPVICMVELAQWLESK
ncbi:MBL fold metallo-hydrolase [Patescibacteria group bacterium]|nr:MBL fold metallo-hydrolase [Patescibacteria group bacterium]